MSFDHMECAYNNNSSTKSSPLMTTNENSNTFPTSIQVAPPVYNCTTLDVQVPRRWSWAVTITSILTMLCCSWGGFCGLMGLIQAIHAYVDHKVGDYKRSLYKTKCAWAFTIAGLVLGVVFWIIVIALAVNAARAAQLYQSEIHHNHMSAN